MNEPAEVRRSHPDDLSDDDLVAIGSLLYHEWTAAYETRKAVKAETHDGTPDWEAFHQERLTAAVEAEALWMGRFDRFKALHRDAVMRGFGL